MPVDLNDSDLTTAAAACWALAVLGRALGERLANPAIQEPAHQFAELADRLAAARTQGPERAQIRKRNRPSTPPVSGSAVVWPYGLAARYGISRATVWRWERKGLLPPRDVHIGGRSGWRPHTLDLAEQPSNLIKPRVPARGSTER